jgi:hypothetical protein
MVLGLVGGAGIGYYVYLGRGVLRRGHRLSWEILQFMWGIMSGSNLKTAATATTVSGVFIPTLMIALK